MARRYDEKGEIHDHYLDRLCKRHHFTSIGVNTDNIELLISKYDFWSNNGDSRTRPDLFILYKNKKWDVIELKASLGRRGKAIKQINSGIEFLASHFNVNPEDCTGRFVVYHPKGSYECEVYSYSPEERRLVKVEEKGKREIIPNPSNL